MSTKRVVIGYIISFILSEICVFISVLCNCLKHGWENMIDFAWWQIGMPIFAACVYVTLTFLGYLLVGKRY